MTWGLFALAINQTVGVELASETYMSKKYKNEEEAPNIFPVAR
jgi:hypothetical protein